MPEHVAVGVDATPDGWVAVRYHDRDYHSVHRYPDDAGDESSAFEALWQEHSDADCLLVDVPIGLPSDDPARKPEVEARKHLDNRQSSVFNVPIRDILNEDEYASANQTQKDVADKGLMQQTFNITHRIREVDSHLRDDDVGDATQDRVREAHPEVCFWALNDDDQDMRFSKSSQPAAAHWERVGVLATAHDDPDAFHDALADAGNALLDWDDPQLSNDDLLDAFALAVTASPLTDEFETLPDDPDADSEGLDMEMVYASPTRSAE